MRFDHDGNAYGDTGPFARLAFNVNVPLRALLSPVQ